MATKTTDWRPGPTVCRCCLSEGCYKDISTEYFWMGKREVYAEMLLDTLSLSIAYSQSGPNSNSRLICEPCISRLRDASDFRRQVQECEKTFMQYLDPGSSALRETEASVCQLETQVKVESVKEEKQGSDDEFVDRGDFAAADEEDDDDLDDQPLTKLASKIPKKEAVDLLDLLDNAKAGEKRKSTTKTKSTSAKKAKSKKEAKATSSKATKPEKKKKGDAMCPVEIHKDVKPQLDKPSWSKLRFAHENFSDELIARKKHVAILLENSEICPFRWVKNLYICFYCDQQYSNPENLRNHHETDHRMRSLSQIKEALAKLKKYELLKADVTNVNCSLCDEEIPDFASLKRHLLMRHNKNIDPKSSDGVLPFKVTREEFKCAICNELYMEFKSLNHHMNIHFQNFICEQCGTGFITPDRLRTHAFSHETGSFACDNCDKVFRSNNAKNEHFATVHMKVKRHRCPHCSESFRNYFQRNKHISNYHGLKLKEFRCTMCPKVFTLSGKLGVHIRTVHLKEKRHACDVCEWKFYSKSELKEHMIRHGGERKYQCNICKKAYARNYTLRQHLRIHDNDKRFVCSICERSFVQNCSLKHHIKIHHPSSLIGYKNS